MKAPSIVKVFIYCLASLAVLINVGCVSNKAQKNKTVAFPKPPDAPRYYYQNTILSDLDVIKETEESRVNRWLTGIGQTGKPMTKPYAVAVKSGRVLVSDPPARLVRIYSFRDNEYIEVGKKGESHTILQKPFGIALDDQENIYVIDRTAGNIKVYDLNGVYKSNFGDKTQFDMPTGIALSLDGAKAYVSDTGGVSSEKHQILVYNTSTGELINKFGARGTEDGQLNFPKGLAMSAKGELFVVDSGNFRVVVFNPETGEMLRKFGSVGRKSGNFSRPKSISVCDNGIVAVSDAAFGNVQLFNEKGELLMFIGERGAKLEPATFMLTAGVSCDEDGRIFLADQFFRKIDVFRPIEINETEGHIALIKKAE